MDAITRFRERLEAGLHTRGLSIAVYETIPSTNDRCKQCGEEGAPEGTVILARAQTAGRGTRGRSFFSPEGTGVYMSVLLRPDGAATEALSLTTAAAVAVCRAVERVSRRKAEIKWVNDVYCDDRKVCGILTEASLSPDNARLTWAVLGVGINVESPKNGFPADLNGIAGAVFEDGNGDAAVLAAAVLDEFFAVYPHRADRTVTEEYRRRSLLRGRAITVTTAAGERTAVALDIDEQCRLGVRFDDGEEATLSSGDVRIRL